MDEIDEDIDYRTENHLLDAVERIENAIYAVREEVKDSSASSFLSGFGWIVVFWFLFSSGISAWHSKWRYAAQYQVSTNAVHKADEPHDCSFMTAPLGEKHCHYDATVSTLRWATSTTQQPIASFDEGKTWSVFTPDVGKVVPQGDTVEEVFVGWDKKSD
jgi:hypothetical protein